LKERAARRGAHRRGAYGGDARTESNVEEGFRRQKTGEVDAWEMGTKARRSSMDGRDKRRTGEEKDRPATGGSVLRGGGPEGWTLCEGRAEEREGERRGPGCGVEQRVVSAAAARPRRVRATRYSGGRGVGTTRSTWLTGAAW
jgi:hypothetical protein